MKMFFFIILVSLIPLLAGCESREFNEREKAWMINTGGITQYGESEMIHGCTVVTNVPFHGMWRTVVNNTNHTNPYSAGWSSKQIPIGSKVVAIPVQVNNFSGDRMRRVTLIIEPE